MGRFTAAAVCSAIALLAGCSSPESAGPEIQRLTAHVEQRLPFDSASFTQGLEVAEDGTIYVGRSDLTRTYCHDPSRRGALKPRDLYHRLIPALIQQGKAALVEKTGKKEVYAFRAES